MKKENSISRRSFLKSTAMAGALGAIGTGSASVLTSCAGGGESAAANKPLKEPGTYYIPELPDKATDGKELKAGVIGCGGRGSGAAENFLDAANGVTVVAVADTFKERVDALADKLKEKGCNIPEDKRFVGLDAYKQLIDSGVDVVIIATPPVFRPVHFQYAVEKGKHCFLEKPICVDPVGYRTIMATAKQAQAKNLCVVTGTQRHHQRNYVESYKKIMEGAIGEITGGVVYWNQSMLWFRERQKDWNDCEYMIKDWVNWKWLSGDHIVEQHVHNIDVFTIIENDHSAYVNFMHIGNGAIVQAYTFEYKKRLDESKEELLSLGIIEMRNRFKSTAREIIVPFKLDMQLENVTFTIPQRGDKKKLLDLSEMNVKQFKVDRLKQAEKLNPEQRNTRILKEIQEALHLEKLPAHIECFDNSNIQGSDAVAACVVFKMGKPSKQEYRKYNIKTVVGPDDYASMKEVVRRRYGRAIEERSPLPDLIITDGGKGQMEVVRSVVEDELGLSIPIAGLAKDGKHRTSELLFGFPPVTVGMRLDSPLFHLLTRIQDEVHRFAITFHKDKRSKTQTKSELDTIKGIGEKTKVLLLRHFKSVKRIKEASFEELKSVIGEAKAKALQEGLDGKRTESEQK